MVMQAQKQYNTEYYNRRKVIDEKNTPGEVDFIEDVLDLHPPDIILDLCCGYGRHCFELAKRGYSTIGLDLSHDLLSIGEKIRKTEKIKRVKFVQGSMQFLPFRRRTFDGVICMDCSFGVLSEEGNTDTLLAINRSLKPDGFLFLQLGNREFLSSLSGKENRITSGNRTYISRTWIDNTSKRMFGKWFIFENGKKIYEVIDTDQGCRLYTLPELRTLLDETGFEVISVYSNVSKQSFESYSQQMLVVARKRIKKERHNHSLQAIARPRRARSA